MENQNKRDTKRAATILETAEVTGLSTSEIQKTLRGDRNNDKVIEVFMFLQEGKTALIEAVKQLVPFH